MTQTDTYRATCSHESGHAAMCLMLDVPVQLITAIGDADTLGRTFHDAFGTTDADLTTRIKVVLGGLIESADTIADMPGWPLDPDAGTSDKRTLWLLAKALDLDAAGYAAVVSDALEIWQSPEYQRTHAAVSSMLERHRQLDRDAVARIKAVLNGGTVEHKTLDVQTTDTDQELGTFSAVVSSWEADRERDTIARDAFDGTIAAWQSSGKNLPLLFEHSTETVGAIDPHTMRATDDGLLVSGEVDRSTDTGQQVWRQVKANTIGFSIGFLSESQPREGGGRHITTIDLFEISATSTPIHPAARAVALKSAGHDDHDRTRTEWQDTMTRLLTGSAPSESLRQKSDRLARDHQPVVVAQFPC